MKKIFAFLLTLSLVILCAAAAFAEGGFFGWLAGSEYADERMALLEEVSDAVKKLRRDPAQAETLEALNLYATSYFADNGHMIALN